MRGSSLQAAHRRPLGYWTLRQALLILWRTAAVAVGCL